MFITTHFTALIGPGALGDGLGGGLHVEGQAEAAAAGAGGPTDRPHVLVGLVGLGAFSKVEAEVAGFPLPLGLELVALVVPAGVLPVVGLGVLVEGVESSGGQRGSS